MPTTTVKRSVSIPTDLDDRLSKEPNASRTVTELLTTYFARRDEWANGQERHEVKADDGTRYRFTGALIAENEHDSIEYFVSPDGGKLFVVVQGNNVDVLRDDEVADYVERYGAPDAVCEAFDVPIVVDLDV